VRRTLGLVLVVAVAALGALILGEYELTAVVAGTAGLVMGVLLAELMVTVGRWRGVVPALLVAAAAGGCLAWAGWLDAGEGVEPYPATAWVGVAIAAAAAAVRLRPHPSPTPEP
jgi:hypothetical protein